MNNVQKGHLSHMWATKVQINLPVHSCSLISIFTAANKITRYCRIYEERGVWSDWLNLWPKPSLPILAKSPVCKFPIILFIAPDKVFYFSTEKDWYLSYYSPKTCCGYSLEAPLRGPSNEFSYFATKTYVVGNEYQQHRFSWRNKKTVM